MENSERSTHGGLTVLERIPGESNPRLPICVVLLVKGLASTRANDRHNNVLPWCERPRISQQIGEIRAFFIGHAIELVAQAQSQRKVRAKLPLILPKPVIF